MAINNRHTSSFRDPSGYIFIDNGVIKRLIKPIYFEQYNALNDSGFFNVLQKKEFLVNHSEVARTEEEIVIQPDQIPFITYPYEWSFYQYKDAALLTLKLQKYALEKGFSLKDASAFNVTFHKGKAIFIDTLSFDFYVDNTPWRAYKQFITHFFGPLLLASYHGSSVLKLMSNYMDGIPVDTIASLLPFKTKLNPFLYSNIHLLAKFENRHNEDYKNESKAGSLSKKAQIKIIETLYNHIKGLKLKESSEWGDYYSKTNYSDNSLLSKSEIIESWVNLLKSKTLIDVGGNTGFFVRSINSGVEHALVCDIDNNAVDENYKQIRKNKENYITPFVLDVLNPSPAIGFSNMERASFLERIQKFHPDITLALAVIHHMSLTGNITFDMSAQFFASFSKYLIIEFPKRADSWVDRLLESKREFKAHFNFYTIDNFEFDYSKWFNLLDKIEVDSSERVLFLFKNKKD